MLDTNTPAFRQQYPNGATVYDRTGRRIANVFACNPETGEVITFDSSQLTRAWIRLVNRLPLQQWWRDVSICKRHGFWPAPLRVERIVFNLTVGDAHGFAEGQTISVNGASFTVAPVTHTTIAAID